MKTFFAILTMVVTLLVASIPEYWGLRTLLPSVGLHAPDFTALFWANVWFSMAAVLINIVVTVFQGMD